MPFHVGPTELIIVLVIVVIILGIGKLPQVGGAMGNAIREFRRAQSGSGNGKTAALPPPTEGGEAGS